MAKTFILGVGAQRTGSTWLHAQIKKTKQINTGLCKEHHVFDAKFLPNSPKQNKPLLKCLKPGKKPLKSIEKELMRRSFVKNTDRYFNYFDKLYDSNPEIKAVGDFTPSYSMLDAKAFSYINEKLEQRGFHVKVIFIMRDPVERIWSMIHQAAKVRKSLKTSRPIPERQFNVSHFTSPGASKRTRYDRTITELEKVFPRQDIFYGFYESLFTPDTYSQISDFLGIPLKTPLFDTIKNSSLMKNAIEPELAAEVAKHYSDTYEFILQRFGNPMRERWSGYAHLNLP